MTDWVTAHFGSGLDAARRLRREVLGQLGAEPEWTIGTDTDTTVTWLAGPLATSLSIRPSGPLIPGLAVLSVRTCCAWVRDLVVADTTIAELNTFATVNRWTVLDKPGPAGWFDDTATGPELATMAAQRSWRLLAPPDPDTTPSVEVGISVVVGDSETDLPVAAVVLAVGEQISQATSLITNDWAAAFGRGFALVAQISQALVAVGDPGGDRRQQLRVGPGGGGVVLPARAHLGGPQWPSIRRGDDLDVPAVVLVLAAPPQIDPAGGSGRGDPVGVDQRAVGDHVRVTGGLGGEQRPVQRGRRAASAAIPSSR